MNKIVFSLILIFALTIPNISAQQDKNHHFEVSKNLEILNSLYKELDLFYVDTINTENIIRIGIEAMLESLDPYTNYIPESEINDFKFMTTGEYAGIGAVIQKRGNKTYIIEPYEEMPAALAGLQAGDELLEIDGIVVEKMTDVSASDKLKGQPNTMVKVKYLRPGSKKPVTVDIQRKRIEISSVPYYGVFGNKTGYIYLTGFTEKCSQDVKAAFEDLKKNHQITSVILDLRGNLGGVMEEAIQIVNMFTPKGKVVVSTKGKVRQLDRTYRTTRDGMDEEIPLVILVNKSSASASEIVSGAIQDLDRGVIIGNRTFGKGLVQTTRELPYNNGVKITTSKYYIPSGRCIQAIDYSHHNPDGSVETIPDSLTSVFHTEKRRPVKDGGGITPDISVTEDTTSGIVYYLMADYFNTIFDFVTEWKNSHPTIAPVEQFTLSDADYDTFKKFLKTKDFKYNQQSEKAMGSLKEIMKFEGYFDNASEEFKALESKLSPDLDKNLDYYQEKIKEIISLEIIKRYYFKKGEIIQSLKNDKGLDKALEILSDRALYEKTLTVQK